MSGSVKEIVLVGSDGARLHIVDRMGQKGLLLNFVELMERETFIHAMKPNSGTTKVPLFLPSSGLLQASQVSSVCPDSANSRRRCGYTANDGASALPRSIQTLICTCTPCGARVMFMGCAISRVVHLHIAPDDTAGSPSLSFAHPSQIHQHTLQPSRQK